MIYNLLSMSQSGVTALTVILVVVILFQIAAIVYLIVKRKRDTYSVARLATHNYSVRGLMNVKANRFFNSHRKSVKGIFIDSFIYLLLAIICVVWVFPFLYLLLTSLRVESTGLTDYVIPKQWGFDNYINLFTDEKQPFLQWYLNTLGIALVVSVINTLITLLTAYALSRMRFKGRKGLMRFMLILGMFPGFLGMICIYKILDAMGLINSELSIVGLMLVYVSGTMMGYYVSKGFFDTISKSLDEAAMIDGASRAKIFFSIILPLSKPIIIQTLLGAFVGPWGDYMMASYIVGSGGSAYKTVAIGLYAWLDISTLPKYFTRFCAGGVVVSILPIVMFFFMQRYYVAGITGGSVKG